MQIFQKEVSHCSLGLTLLSFPLRKILSWAGLECGPDNQDAVRHFFFVKQLLCLKWSKYPEGRRDVSWRMTIHNVLGIKSERWKENWVRKIKTHSFSFYLLQMFISSKEGLLHISPHVYRWSTFDLQRLFWTQTTGHHVYISLFYIQVCLQISEQLMKLCEHNVIF